MTSEKKKRPIIGDQNNKFKILNSSFFQSFLKNNKNEPATTAKRENSLGFLQGKIL